MRIKIKPIIVVAFFLLFIGFLLANEGGQTRGAENSQTTDRSLSETYFITNALEMKPIVDLSGWQRPSDIDYDTLAQQISGAIIRVQSGSHTTRDNTASDQNGLDKSFQTHIEELQARGIPVAVYAYVTGKDADAMKTEAQTFYQAASPYNPTFYWLDVEEKTMSDMNAGVEVFRQELQDLGAKNIGIYIGTYFMQEHSISTEKFDSVWIPTYGSNSGYYDAAPNTDLEYDLHQYTSKGYLQGFAHHLDLNLITTLKDPNQVYAKLFTNPAN